MKPNSKLRDLGVLILSGILFSLTGVWVKLSVWGPYETAWSRSAVCLLCLLFFLLCMRVRPRINVGRYEILAALCAAAASGGFVVCSVLSTATNGIVMIYSAPIYTAIISRVLFKEKLPRYQFIALSVITLGLLLVFASVRDLATGGQSVGEVGSAAMVAGLISGIAWGLYPLAVRRVNGDNIFGIQLLNFTCSVLFFSFLLTRSPLELLSSSPPFSLVSPIGGGVCLVTAYLTFDEALKGKRIPATLAVLVSLFQVPLSAFLVWLVLGEFPRGLALAGDLTIFLGILILSLTPPMLKIRIDRQRAMARGLRISMEG